MIGNKSTMGGRANALTIFLKRSVLDQTGLKGYYDFNVRRSAPVAPDGQSPGGLGRDGLGLLISNLKIQFGLQLTKNTGQVDYGVVDLVEAPISN